MAKVTLDTVQAIMKIHGLEGQNICRAFYKNIFDFVTRNEADWKGPIQSVIHADALDAEFDVIRQAVIYFTGNPDCKVEEFKTNYIKVTTAGYRAGPCG